MHDKKNRNMCDVTHDLNPSRITNLSHFL